jgi:hypothetical protein
MLRLKTPENMPMRKTNARSHLAQPSLFDPLTHRPRWDQLPLEIRHQVLSLLIDLLKQAASRRAPSSQAQGGLHE